MRKLLQKLVANQNVLLHGSPRKLGEIKTSFTDKQMAICATHCPELAIFMALVKTCKYGTPDYRVSGKNSDPVRVTFTLCPEQLQYLITTDPTAYVYAVDAENFERIDFIEHRTYDSVYISDIYVINKTHLPFMFVEDQFEYSFILPNSSAKLLAKYKYDFKSSPRP